MSNFSQFYRLPRSFDVILTNSGPKKISDGELIINQFDIYLNILLKSGKIKNQDDLIAELRQLLSYFRRRLKYIRIDNIIIEGNKIKMMLTAGPVNEKFELEEKFYV